MDPFQECYVEQDMEPFHLPNTKKRLNSNQRHSYGLLRQHTRLSDVQPVVHSWKQQDDATQPTTSLELLVCGFSHFLGGFSDVSLGCPIGVRSKEFKRTR